MNPLTSGAAAPSWRPAPVARTLAAPAGPLALVLAALLALALAHLLYSTPFMRGLLPFWHQQDNDIAQYVAGFNAFVREAWHWPLLRVNSINAPDGTLATFLDTVPLYSLLLKLWQHGPDTPFRNPYPVWIALCFVLQGVGAWWICREAQLRSWMALLAMTLLLAAFPPFAYRINHLGLMGQWLLPLALACYLRSTRLGRLASGAWVALVLAAFYVHIYLFAMVALVFAADLWRHFTGGDQRRALLTAVASGVLLVASLFVTMLPVPGQAGGGEWGFGYYSMNLLGPFAGGRLLQFQHATATDGQGEGYAYVGIFVLMAAAYGVSLRRRLDPAFWTRHRALLAALAAMTCFALSNIVYLGPVELFHLDLPGWVGKITAVLRSSGRFFWPVGYAITAFAVISLTRHLPPRRAGALLLALLCLHAWDLWPHAKRVRASVSVGAVERLHAAQWDSFLGADVKALQVYPPFGCNKGVALQTLLPTMGYAVARQLPISTGYVARVRKPCDNYAQEIAGIRAPSTAFVFIKEEFVDLNAVRQLLGDAAATCIEADFAWLCKRQPAVALEKKP
ncbi:DUF6311 domain-containing protein [Duganella dendranthematis]|uniref:DUF6311 domain-containing protein n=1 Tax=Duganella dendranthematis TaxID=2728021 RepID=UPI001E43ECB0|nr:DUF6311 domain-containing protein [Duganella dendranthematis]